MSVNCVVLRSLNVREGNSCLVRSIPCQFADLRMKSDVRVLDVSSRGGTQLRLSVKKLSYHRGVIGNSTAILFSQEIVSWIEVLRKSSCLQRLNQMVDTAVETLAQLVSSPVAFHWMILAFPQPYVLYKPHTVIIVVGTINHTKKKYNICLLLLYA